MPKVFRTMLKQDEMPSVGTGSSMLGARILTQERQNNYDISPDALGNVHPDTGGISVARSIKDLLPHLIPKRLQVFEADAIGNNNRFIWSMGSGDFQNSPVAEHLYLRKKPTNQTGKIQGLIEPEITMTVENYQSSLAATKSAWSIDEPT